MADLNTVVGQEVKVCGEMIDNATVIESNTSDYGRPNGFTISEHGPLDELYRGDLCVYGTAVFSGCGPNSIAQTGRICLGAVYDYGVRVKKWEPVS